MRFSFEGNRSFRPGSGRLKSEATRKRFCLSCSKELPSDGSSFALRGFCSKNCLDSYTQEARQGDW